MCSGKYRVPNKVTSNPFSLSHSLCLQKWVEWHHISISSGRLYGWYDADTGQCQLANSLHHLGRRPERLPVCRRNTWHCQGICLSFCLRITTSRTCLSFFFFPHYFPSYLLESRCSENRNVHRLHGGDLLG